MDSLKSKKKKRRYYKWMPIINLPGCWIRPRLQFRQMLWNMNHKPRHTSSWVVGQHRRINNRQEGSKNRFLISTSLPTSGHHPEAHSEDALLYLHRGDWIPSVHTSVPWVTDLLAMSNRVGGLFLSSIQSLLHTYRNGGTWEICIILPPPPPLH